MLILEILMEGWISEFHFRNSLSPPEDSGSETDDAAGPHPLSFPTFPFVLSRAGIHTVPALGKVCTALTSTVSSYILRGSMCHC